MLFKQMKEKILSCKNGVWKYKGCEYLLYDETADVCFPTWRHYSTNPLKDAAYVIHPDDTVQIKKVRADYFSLRGLTLNGKIKRGTNYKSRYVYVHDLINVYEAQKDMRISLVTSKPIDARLIDDIPVDKEKFKHARNARKVMREVMRTYLRMDPPIKMPSDKGRMRNHDQNAKWIANIIRSYNGESFKSNDKWTEKAHTAMDGFYIHHAKDEEDKLIIFDNMMRFHEAHVFRLLGVIK